MSSSEGVSPGRSVSMAQSIISMCRCTWSRERRIGVLLRAVDPPLSVWDCVPECIIDAHLKDAFEYHADQRDYLLFYAIPTSAVLRCIRRLDGYRASPLVLKSLHFFSHQKDIDAYNFPPESDFAADFSESEYGEDSIISREWTPSPTSILELDDSDIHTTTEIYNSKLRDEAEVEDEVVRCKPQQWTEYPESEGFEVFIAPLQQSASDADDEASSSEPRLLFPVHPSYTESDDYLKDAEPLEANRPEPQPFSPVHQPSPESDDDLKGDEPLEASSSEPRLLSPVHPSYTEFDDGLKYDEPFEANSPEPRPFSPVHHSSPEPDDEPLEASSSEPRLLFPVHPSYTESNDDLKDDKPLEANSLETQQFSPVHQSSPESNDDLKDDEPLEASSSEQRILSPVHPYYTASDDDLKDDEPLEANNSEPRLFPPVHQPFPESDNDLKGLGPLEANNPEPRPFPGVYQFFSVFDDDEEDEEHQFYPVFDDDEEDKEHGFYPVFDDDEEDEEHGFYPVFDDEEEDEVRQFYRRFYPDDEEDEPLDENNLFADFSGVHYHVFDDENEDEPLDVNNLFADFSGVHYHVFDDDEEYEPLEANNPEPRQLLPAHQFYLEYDYHQRGNESPEADRPEPPRIFPTMYDPQYPQMEIFCPEPIREHATHKVILKPELFDDWFVDMGEINFIDEEATSHEQSNIGTPSSEPQTPSPVRCHTPEPEFGDQASVETHSPKPQRFVPVHRSHPRLYEPQPVLGLDHEGPESLEIWNLYC